MNGSISEIMAQKKADALARVKTALWKDDPDAAADAALKGGVDPVTTDRIASEVQAAKSALAAAVTANAALPELTKSAAATRQAAAKTARALQLAQVANTEASDAAGDAGAAVEVARGTVDAAARLLSSGQIPDADAPDFMRQVVETWKAAAAESERQALRSNLGASIRYLESRIQMLDTELKRQRGLDPLKQEVEATSSGLAPLQDILAGRLRLATAQLEEARRQLQELG